MGQCERKRGTAANRRCRQPSEAAAVVEELRRIAITQRFAGEMGVVTPIPSPANLIEELIARDDALAPVLASRNFISETAHKFQGDERDLSWSRRWCRAVLPSDNRVSQKPGKHLQCRHYPRSRGACRCRRRRGVCRERRGISERICPLCRGSRQSIAAAPAPAGRRIRPRLPGRCPTRLVSDWEKVFYAALVDAGLRPIPQFDIDQYILDFALIRPNGRRLNIEIDGERYHRDWDGESFVEIN